MTSLASSLRWREQAFALLFAGSWAVTLWVIDYPVEEWIGVMAVAYATFVVARLAVGSLLAAAAKLSKGYTERVTQRVAEETEIDVATLQAKALEVPKFWVLIAAFVLAWGGATIGLSLLLMMPVLHVAEFPSVGPAFVTIAALIGGVSFGALVLQVAVSLGCFLIIEHKLDARSSIAASKGLAWAFRFRRLSEGAWRTAQATLTVPGRVGGAGLPATTR